MDQLLPILVAAAVVLLVFGLVQGIRTLLDPNRRKLQDRLSNERTAGFGRGGESFASRSIRLENEAKGLSARLAKFGPLSGLHRRVVHAAPNMSLAMFLIIVGALGL